MAAGLLFTLPTATFAGMGSHSPSHQQRLLPVRPDVARTEPVLSGKVLNCGRERALLM